MKTEKVKALSDTKQEIAEAASTVSSAMKK
jgi:hypothetical protein